MKVGYARVSSTGQNLESQLEKLELVGCSKIFQEKMSGTKADNRTQLQEAIAFAREGDVFIVTRLDRCSRSVNDLYQIMEQLKIKGVDFKATEQDLDTTTSTGRLMIGLLSIVSAFETDLRAERQSDGIKSALNRGIKFGRKHKLDTDAVIEAIKLKEQGYSNQQIANKFSIGKSTLLRYFADGKAS
jgi:DNA invertase Pin-like site-specific DNA recombinase